VHIIVALVMVVLVVIAIATHPDSREDFRDAVSMGLGCLWLLVLVGVVGGLIYIAVHFIVKYW